MSGSYQKFPVGTRVVFRPPPGAGGKEWDGVTGTVCDADTAVNNAVRLDGPLPFRWGLDWCHTSPDWLQRLEPPSPFEVDLMSYIESEKKELGIV